MLRQVRMYFSKLTAFWIQDNCCSGSTIASPANHGYLNYIIAHLMHWRSDDLHNLFWKNSMEKEFTNKIKVEE